MGDEIFFTPIIQNYGSDLVFYLTIVGKKTNNKTMGQICGR
jgi:hypothetical protein